MKATDDKVPSGTEEDGAISISPPLSFCHTTSAFISTRKSSSDYPLNVKGSKGLKRRFSESARDLSGEGFSRLTRFGSGLKRKLSNSAKDLLTGHIPSAEKSFSKDDIKILDETGASLLGVVKLEGTEPSCGKNETNGADEKEENLNVFPPAVTADEGSRLRRQISTSMKDLFTSSKTPQEKRIGQRKKLSRRLSFLTEVMLGKLEKSSCSNKLSRSKRVRIVEVEVLQPNGARCVICGKDNQSVREFLSPLKDSLCITSFALFLEDSMAEVDLDAPAMLLDGDKVVLSDLNLNEDFETESDVALRLTKKLLRKEAEFVTRLNGVDEIYGQPLRKLSSINDEEYQQLFAGIHAVLRTSIDICTKLSHLVSSWDGEQLNIDSIFNNEVWEAFEFYLNHRPLARLTLLEKESQDEEFVDFCKLRRGAAKHSLLQLLNLPAERLSEYEQYFASLLVDTHPDHPDHCDISRNHERLGQLVTRQEDDFGELERIQELFPNDNLKLFEKDPVSQKMKGLIRKRSTTAARLQRAFSAKGLRTAENNNNNNNNSSKDSPYHNNNQNHNESNSNGDYNNSGRSKEGKPKRQFIMETPVQFTTGVQSQERHLFLFTDLLLVAKARSGGNFKLKEKVRVSEMWLANCLDDVAEVSKSSDTSFVLGWPTTNVVASFSCVATKDLWYNKLSQVIAEERENEPPSTTIQVTHYDPLSNTDICKTVSISSTTTARECVSLVLDHLELSASDESKFQLWVKSPSEEAPYPLIGHELPFAIRMNCLRDIMQECDAEQCGNLYNSDIMSRCQFILRQERKPTQTGIIDSPDGGKKVSKKAKKSPIRIHRVFKRSNSKGDVTDGSVPNNSGGVLFGQPLHKICDTDGGPPKPIMDLLHQLFQKGPFTVGIFRKSANARLVRELKEKLDNGEEIVDLDGVHITSIAALFKDFLRSLPDCLLCADLYEEWLELPRLSNARERVSRTLLLCSRLPRPHLNLLQFFLCVLHHIAKRAAENMMSASNLAVCVGPSILWPASPILALSPEASKEAPATVEFLIERCSNVFGKDILTLLGDPPEQDPLRLDSGAEESDSLHSLHSGHSMHSSGGMRRDDSSIDSLERELIGEGELSPLPRKDKMSLTNLSRDSGLTMSDSQLYTPDEEESGSTSSSHSGGEKTYAHNQQERPNDRFQHYSAPNNPNAIYTAVYRRPEKTQQNHFDDPDSYYAAPNREHTRVQITYSSQNYNNYGNQSPQKEYTRVYHDRHNSNVTNNGYPHEEEDAIYSVPNSIPSQHMLPFVASSNFQRHDWTRRCSNLRKVSKTNSVDGGLVRSTSEESLLNKYNAHEYGVSLGAAGNSGEDQLEYYSKGRALPPIPTEYEDPVREPVGIGGRESPLRRSKSAHQIIDGNDCRLVPNVDQNTQSSRSNGKDNAKWHRSRSTPHIHEEGDRSYDSSTLSDDDSTPHVSRSNSRGKEYSNGSLHAWDSSDSHNSRNSSFKSERTGSMCTVVSAGSTSTLSSNPPSYEEALNRRSLMHNKSQQQNTSNGSAIPDYAIREEKMKSARAKQLYEESLRIYQEENAYPCDLVRASPAHAHDSDDPERPPPLPPKSDPPPLPPKQKSNRKSSEGSNRLKHLPPVHVEITGRKSRSVTSLPANQIAYDPPLHKTIIYTDDNPPVLPPKERTVIEVESAYNPSVEKKSIETQTDECDLLEEDVKDEGIQTSGSWIAESSPSHVTSVSVTVPDTSFREGRRRGRPRRKNCSSQRSRSMPGRESSGRNHSSDCEEDDDEDEEWNVYENASRDFPGNTYGLRDLKQLDPDLQQEISWSVSQLRAIFGDSLKGAKVHPPPYRPPPTHRSPITSYHLGAGDTFIGRSKQRPHSNYGEESYV